MTTSQPAASSAESQPPAQPGRPRRTRGFIEKTIADVAAALERMLFEEEIARRPGLLQSLDPRAKLVALLALLLAVSLSHSLIVLAGLYLLTLPAAVASAVPLGFYLKRVWIFMPFFTGVVVLPALFSVFSPGPALLTLVDLGPDRFYLAITWPGVTSAAYLLLRVAGSVSLSLLLVLTTRWALLLKSLRVLLVPHAFVLILAMTYRYVHLLLQSMNNMFLARRSRLVGRISGAEHRRWIAASMGTLLGKSYGMSEEVYLAMQSRGFRGEVQTLDTLIWHRRDSIALAGALLVAGVATWLGRVL